MKRPAGHNPAGGAFGNKVVQKPVKTGGPNRANRLLPSINSATI